MYLCLHHVIESGYNSSFYNVHNLVIVFKTSKQNEDGNNNNCCLLL